MGIGTLLRVGASSVFLLSALIAAWVIIAAFFLRDLVRKRKKNA